MAAKDTESTAAKRAAGPPLELTRILNAPRELVFKVWTDPAYLKHWWGPRGFTLPEYTADLRPGGAFRYVMRGPDGRDYASQGVFVELVPPERLVTRGTIHDNPEFVLQTTVTFEDQNGRTKLTVRQEYTFESDATRGAPEGWRQTLDRLAEYLAQPAAAG